VVINEGVPMRDGEDIELRNHTPHDVTILLPEGGAITLAPEPKAARCLVTRVGGAPLRACGVTIPTTLTRRGAEVVGLPPAEHGVVLVVSLPVVEACPDRTDLVFPDEQVRDPDNRVIGCRSLGRLRGEPFSGRSSSRRAPRRLVRR
jgi:hypothetical protein